MQHESFVKNKNSVATTQSDRQNCASVFINDPYSSNLSIAGKLLMIFFTKGVTTGYFLP